jgi:gamma-glutamyltranspeptidase/glutathione hydrolase
MSGAPKWVGATPGGVNQMPWNAQTLARLLRGEERPGMLVAGPLWEWIPEGDGLRIEVGFGAEDVDALRAQTEHVVKAPRWGCKSAHQVVRLPADGEAWQAAADPRTVGLALGI